MMAIRGSENLEGIQLRGTKDIIAPSSEVRTKYLSRMPESICMPLDAMDSLIMLLMSETSSLLTTNREASCTFTSSAVPVQVCLRQQRS